MRSPTLSSDPVSKSKRTKSGSTPVLRIQDRIRFEISSKKRKSTHSHKQSGSRHLINVLPGHGEREPQLEMCQLCSELDPPNMGESGS
ncbi:hypothetical protein TNIN_407101 [Trichonephila inaurata madagascariensis]|uniref:Uncharacterized protein n=1 Tax=Trichonephila inaurata madagascariensis TaxID=2747483 RepID=A0A8X6WRL5_9ARAC|nr:hypothetical protein TNIN_407101 [Trichonephila inaurata madagascariensis]